MSGIAFKATVNRLGSASTGGFKITLDVPESEVESVSALLKEYIGVVYSVAFIAEPKQ
jgi:hypothetical protein